MKFWFQVLPLAGAKVLQANEQALQSGGYLAVRDLPTANCQMPGADRQRLIELPCSALSIALFKLDWIFFSGNDYPDMS
jgi:hypothetical protein